MKIIKSVLTSLLLVFAIALVYVGAQTSIESGAFLPELVGTIDSAGTDFAITDSEYLNIII